MSLPHARPTCRPPPSLLYFGPCTRSHSFHPSDRGVEHMSDTPIHDIVHWKMIVQAFKCDRDSVSRVNTDPIYPVRTALPIRRRWLHNLNGFRDLSSFLQWPPPLFLLRPPSPNADRPCLPLSIRPSFLLRRVGELC